jgi:hypothetical protein
MLGAASRNGRCSRAVLLAATLALGEACTSESKSSAPGGPLDILVWDFPTEPPPPTLRLWPLDPASPQRKRRGLTATDEAGRLATVVTGTDPGFSWSLESPIAAAFVRVEVEALAPGPLQLFIATSRCPVFSEPCSATAQLNPGRNVVNFPLDPAAPLRAFRLDPPDVLGARFWFDLVALRTGALTDTPFTPREPLTTLASTPTGLRLEASGSDPGMVVETPGLEASRVTAIELVLRSASGVARPQLFWEGPCGSFSEACSAFLPTTDAGALTHRAVLARHRKWSGRIGALRLDPGPSAGEYLIQRIALVRDPAD